MEPTIRKGEQSREENSELDPALWDDFVEQASQAPDVDVSALEEEELTIDGDNAQFQSDDYDQPDIADQPQYSDDIQTLHVAPEEQSVEATQPQFTADVDMIPSETQGMPQQVLPAQPTDSVGPSQAEPDEQGVNDSQDQLSGVVGEDPTVQPIQTEADGQSQPSNAFQESIDSQADNPLQQNEPQPASLQEVTALEQEILPTNDPAPIFTTDFLPLPASEEVQVESTPRKVALILSGGGARGAFQVGAEKYAREVKGYQWDIIAGVSVGAMNGAMLAMHRYKRLLELWDHISDNQVYTGGFNFVSLVKILFGAKSFYGNEPLKRLMQGEFEAGRVIDDLHVGAVSLVSGEYVQFTRQSLELSKAILASASIPVVWPPVEVSAEYPDMVDGGVRNITPVGDVLELEPDEIVIINCGNEKPPSMPKAPSNVLSIGTRALDIMQNEIFVNDMKEFLRINALVKEAEQQGVVLHHPKSGRPLKYFPCQVIEPDIDLGETLDFSQQSIQAALRAGVRRAREVLGRP
jgi:NTE family protein